MNVIGVPGFEDSPEAARQLSDDRFARVAALARRQHAGHATPEELAELQRLLGL
ncbi:MAG: hypothetical protein ACRC33_05550 [Gemmataceae bacterium]